MGNIISREISSFIEDCFNWYPIVSLTGARQAGKTTLIRNLFPQAEYINLELETNFARVSADPLMFLNTSSNPLIIDEAQRVPKLFNSLQVVSDERNTTGQYLISGSQNFLLQKNISQSLAGRVALIKLLPFSYREAKLADPSLTIAQFIVKGGYPRLYTQAPSSYLFFEDYLNTYIRRDLHTYILEKNLNTFEKFVRILAHYAGQLINYTKLSNAVGVSSKTIRNWLDYLEASNIIFYLQPYYTNSLKTLVKTPKLYFFDTGLLCYLLRIDSTGALYESDFRGALYENFAISEIYKAHNNVGNHPDLYFYRDDSKREVDLIDNTIASDCRWIEIKSTQTYKLNYSRHLDGLFAELKPKNASKHVLMDLESSFPIKDVHVDSFEEYLCEKNNFPSIYRMQLEQN